MAAVTLLRRPVGSIREYFTLCISHPANCPINEGRGMGRRKRGNHRGAAADQVESGAAVAGRSCRSRPRAPSTATASSRLVQWCRLAALDCARARSATLTRRNLDCDDAPIRSVVGAPAFSSPVHPATRWAPSLRTWGLFLICGFDCTKLLVRRRILRRGPACFSVHASIGVAAGALALAG